MEAAELVDLVEAAIEDAEGEIQLPADLLAVSGMSSPIVRQFLNSVCAFERCRYVEVGTWKGSTLLAAAHGNRGVFTGVDNFSQFGRAKRIRELLYANLERFVHRCPVHFHGAEAIQFAATLPDDSINVLFLDGDHSPGKTQEAIEAYAHALQDPAIVIVDDWNWKDVRAGTVTAFHSLGWHVAKDWEKLTPGNNCRDDWWNGVYIAVIEKRMEESDPEPEGEP